MADYGIIPDGVIVIKKRKKTVLIILACALALAALGGSTYWLMNSRSVQLFGKIVSRVDTDKKVIALTFDDGPSERTPEILEMLNELDVKCTFFLTGKEIEANMDYARAIAKEGHQIGSHSYSHGAFVFKSGADIDAEIDKTNALIRDAGYGGDIVFRPPYCKKLLLLPLALMKRNMTTIIWDVEPDSFPDVASSPEGIAEYVIEHAKSGSIILLHIMRDGGKNARDALPAIVEGLRSKGFEFSTVSELMNTAEQ